MIGLIIKLTIHVPLNSILQYYSPLAVYESMPRHNPRFIIKMMILIINVSQGAVIPLSTTILGRWSPPMELSRMSAITFSGRF